MRIERAVAATATWAVAIAQSASSTTDLINNDGVQVTTALTTGIPSGVSDSPCASVSVLSAQALASPTSGDSALPTVPAQLAYDCLNSVPLEQGNALKLLDSIVPYLQYHSSLEILKSPPSGYQLPGIDLEAGIDKIRQNITSNAYKGEYAFQVDLYNLINSAHDDHLSFTGDTFSAFSWQRGTDIALVSVSEDGQALPKIYLYDDIQQATNSSNKLNAITAIDGQDPVSTLKNISVNKSLQDADALYNAMFFELARVVNDVGDKGFFQSNQLFPGQNTTITFEDGTTKTYESIAIVTEDFTGVDSGESFYSTLCSGQPQNSSAIASSTASPASTTFGAIPSSPAPIAASPEYVRPPSSGYPYPVVAHSRRLVGGYFLNETDLNNVAVLSIPSFDTARVPDPKDSNAAAQEFQSVVQQFFAACKTAGKTKLIIDLQGNGGGTVGLGYDTFLQLFPTITPYGATNMRTLESLDILGQAETQLLGMISPLSSTNQTAWLEGLAAAQAAEDWNYQVPLTVNNTNFGSWDELYSPQQAYGDNFTSLLRVNLSSTLISMADSGVNYTGYADRTNFTVQPFAAGDIVMTTDGLCGSACAVFSEFMKVQGKVKVISLGGRPNFGPSQAVGGSKGAKVLEWSVIEQQVRTTYSITTEEQKAMWNESDLAKITTYPMNRSADGFPPSLNWKNNIRVNDTSLTPLQFVYEASDCRLWYTPKMVLDISEVWKSVAQVAFGNGSSLCVTNSTGDPSSLSGNALLNGTETPPSSSPSPPPPSETSAGPALPGAASAYRVGVGSIILAGLAMIASLL